MSHVDTPPSYIGMLLVSAATELSQRHNLRVTRNAHYRERERNKREGNVEGKQYKVVRRIGSPRLSLFFCLMLP